MNYCNFTDFGRHVEFHCSFSIDGNDDCDKFLAYFDYCYEDRYEDWEDDRYQMMEETDRMIHYGEVERAEYNIPCVEGILGTSVAMDSYEIEALLNDKSVNGLGGLEQLTEDELFDLLDALFGKVTIHRKTMAFNDQFGIGCSVDVLYDPDTRKLTDTYWYRNKQSKRSKRLYYRAPKKETLLSLIKDIPKEDSKIRGMVIDLLYRICRGEYPTPEQLEQNRIWKTKEMALIVRAATESEKKAIAEMMIRCFRSGNGKNAILYEELSKFLKEINCRLNAFTKADRMMLMKTVGEINRAEQLSKLLAMPGLFDHKNEFRKFLGNIINRGMEGLTELFEQVDHIENESEFRSIIRTLLLQMDENDMFTYLPSQITTRIRMLQTAPSIPEQAINVPHMVGTEVQHRTLGSGTVIEQAGDMLRIRFENKVCKFRFPDAFYSFLSVPDAKMAAEILSGMACAEKAAKAEKDHFIDRLAEEIWAFLYPCII